MLFRLVLTSSFAFLAVSSMPAAVQADDVDRFEDARGATSVQVNGAAVTVTGEFNNGLYPFAGIPDYANGKLKIVIKEDNSLKGADEKPGVVSFQLAELPSDSQYFGFCYANNAADGGIKLPAWTPGMVTNKHLEKTVVSFKYRMTNKGRRVPFNVRFEPRVEDSYEMRADFGSITATDQWQTFSIVLSDTTNLGSFLDAVNRNKTTNYLIVWGQDGDLFSYKAGDTLLIDDIEVKSK